MNNQEKIKKKYDLMGEYLIFKSIENQFSELLADYLEYNLSITIKLIVKGVTYDVTKFENENKDYLNSIIKKIKIKNESLEKDIENV